jgi:hypothetical protein
MLKSQNINYWRKATAIATLAKNNFKATDVDGDGDCAPHTLKILLDAWTEWSMLRPLPHLMPAAHEVFVADTPRQRRITVVAYARSLEASTLARVVHFDEAVYLQLDQWCSYVLNGQSFLSQSFFYVFAHAVQIPTLHLFVPAASSTDSATVLIWERDNLPLDTDDLSAVTATMTMTESYNNHEFVARFGLVNSNHWLCIEKMTVCMYASCMYVFLLSRW